MVDKKTTAKLDSYKLFIDDFKTKIDSIAEKTLLEKAYFAFLQMNTQLKKTFKTDTTRIRYTAAGMCSEAIKKYNEKLKNFTGK